MVSLLVSTTVPRMLPVLVFGDSVDCPDAGATRINPPARAMSRNRGVKVTSAPRSQRDRDVYSCVSLTFLASRQVEVNCDLRVDFDRLSIQEIWPVTPLLYRFDCGLCEYPQTALDANILHGAIFADHCRQHYRPFNPGAASFRRILRRNVVDQVGFHHRAGNPDSLWRGGRH